MTNNKYPYLVLDSWSYRNKTEPVMASCRTRREADEHARRLNHNLAIDHNGLTRYRVYEARDEELEEFMEE